MNPRVLVIAEAGVNHNGSLSQALQLVEVAAEAGADIVKFQTFRAEKLVSASAAKADYQKVNTGNDEPQLAMLKRLELTDADHHALVARCEALGIGFLSTPFDDESIDFLDGLKMPLFKVPSGEITNIPYLRRVGGKGKPVILSTGMSTLGEIETAINVLRVAGSQSISVLHCNTEYPTPFIDVNLKAMQTLAQAFRVPVGYSDHTLGLEVPVAAVALGATIIEKHFTLDRSLPGPDQLASLEPDELKSMVSMIRNIEAALSGDGSKRVSASERKNLPIARRSIVAQRPIRAGEVFTEENLAAKRPGTGISVAEWDKVLGRTARRDFQTDDMIEW